MDTKGILYKCSLVCLFSPTYYTSIYFKTIFTGNTYELKCSNCNICLRTDTCQWKPLQILLHDISSGIQIKQVSSEAH